MAFFARGFKRMPSFGGFKSDFGGSSTGFKTNSSTASRFRFQDKSTINTVNNFRTTFEKCNKHTGELESRSSIVDSSFAPSLSLQRSYSLPSLAQSGSQSQSMFSGRPSMYSRSCSEQSSYNNDETVDDDATGLSGISEEPSTGPGHSQTWNGSESEDTDHDSDSDEESSSDTVVQSTYDGRSSETATSATESWA